MRSFLWRVKRGSLVNKGPLGQDSLFHKPESQIKCGSKYSFNWEMQGRSNLGCHGIHRPQWLRTPTQREHVKQPCEQADSCLDPYAVLTFSQEMAFLHGPCLWSSSSLATPVDKPVPHPTSSSVSRKLSELGYKAILQQSLCPREEGN